MCKDFLSKALGAAVVRKTFAGVGYPNRSMVVHGVARTFRHALYEEHDVKIESRQGGPTPGQVNPAANPTARKGLRPLAQSALLGVGQRGDGQYFGQNP